MPDILDIIDTNASPEEQMDSIRKNFTMVSKAGLKSGNYLLESKSSKVSQSITSTTRTALTEFQFSIQSSGGMVSILANFVAAVADKNRVGYITMEIDDVVVSSGQLGNTFVGDAGNGAQYGTIALCYISNIITGKHTVKFYGYLNTGGSTFTVGATDLISTVYITESIRG